MTADKKNNIKNQNNNKRKYKAACNCEQPKNISRFRPYKKEKTKKKKFVKSKLHTLKTKYVLLTKTRQFHQYNSYKKQKSTLLFEWFVY